MKSLAFPALRLHNLKRNDMKKEQSDIDDSGRAQNSVLSERLLARSTGLVGMIDARHPQRLHAHTAGWVARRFGMLDHWRTRYEDAGRALNASGDLVFTAPTQPPTEIGNMFEGAPSRDIVPSDAVPPAMPTAPLLRVSRRPPTPVAAIAAVPTLARLADSPGAPAGIEKSDRAEAAAPVGTTPIARADVYRLLAGTEGISARQVAASRPDLIWRKSVDGEAADGGAGSGLTGFTASPLPLKIEPASAPTLAREISNSSVTETGKTASAAPPPVSGAVPPAQRIDTTRLAEQVGRMLSRQFAVERERRGIR
jgi:hypothetical protein